VSSLGGGSGACAGSALGVAQREDCIAREKLVVLFFLVSWISMNWRDPKKKKKKNEASDPGGCRCRGRKSARDRVVEKWIQIHVPNYGRSLQNSPHTDHS
jgi:hypothetical protein